MDPLRDPFFSNLLQGGSNIDEQFMESQSQYLSQVGQVMQKESQFSIQKESVTKKPRGGNFSVEEDDMLVSAWLNTSLDAVQGNEQKSKIFWMRVWEYFHDNKNFISERNDISLMNLWSVIQLATNKFCGCLAQVESMHESGKTEQDKIRDAKLMYQELSKSKTSFQFEHCWDVLKHQPKWIAECQKKKPKRSRSVVAPSPELINPEEDVSHDTFVDLERATGRKFEKERRKKSKINEQANASIVVVLNEIKEERKIANEKKLEMLEKSYGIQAKKIQMEQLKEEERIMMLDTSGMTPMLQEYYHRRQIEVIESRKNKSQVVELDN